MNFPARPSAQIAPPPELTKALGVEPLEVFVNEFNYLALLTNQTVLRTLEPDMPALARVDRPGVIVTAPGDDEYDFVSRYFAPAKGIPEDPVTGAAHCMLAPFWAGRLGKCEFRAFQASPRGGESFVGWWRTGSNWREAACFIWKGRRKSRKTGVRRSEVGRDYLSLVI
jgi:predicted PhzF superfamily epimerase YddE/YHI9